MQNMQDNNTENKLVPELNLTVAELAEELGEDYIVANSFLKILVKAGIAKENGTRAKAPGTRGKAATVFSFPQEFNMVLFPDENTTTAESPAASVAPAEPAPTPESAQPEQSVPSEIAQELTQLG